MKKITPLLFITIFLFIAIFFNTTESDKVKLPVPTEFVEKKIKRKEFKKFRKEYIEQMHRAHPNINWKKMDEESRKIRTSKVQELRKNLVLSNNLVRDNKYVEYIHRNLSGYWQERGSNNLAGRILTSDIDWGSSLIYCASDGGNIWRGTLTGQDWISLNDYMQVKGIHFLRLIEFDDIRRLLICNSKTFYYTDDEGMTLNQSNGLEFLSEWGGNYIKRAIATDDKVIYILANEGTGNWNAVGTIYKSIDNGRNFVKIISLDVNLGMSNNQNVDHYDIWTSRYFPSFIYLLHNDEFYRITDSDELEFVGNLPVINNGENILTGGMGSNAPFFYSHVGDKIYQSINGGNSWIDRGERPQWYFNLQNSFNSSNINRDDIYWGGIEVFKSINGANSWSLINNWWEYYGNESSMLHADIPEIRFFLDLEFNEVALISTDGGLYYSDDQLETVHNISMNGLGVSQYYSTYTKRAFPFNVYAGAQDQGFQRSINPGNGVLDFEQSISGDYGHIVSGNDGETLWCNYPGFTMYYQNPETDGSGETLDFPGSGHLWLAPLMADPYNEDRVYLGGGGLSGGNHLFYISMGGWSLSYEEQPFNFDATVSAMAFSSLEPQHRYVLTSVGSFYHSNNNGLNWQKSNDFNGPDAHYFYGSTIWASESIPGKVIIGGSGYSNSPVYISFDYGENFEALDNGLPNTLVYKLTGTPDDEYYFAATELGPYVYISENNEWIDLAGISAPDQTYWSVEYIPDLKTVRFGTYGRGIWDFVINDELIMGDINFDLEINIQDIILIINFVLGIEEPNSLELTVGDLNADYILNIQDIITIINLILD